MNKEEIEKLFKDMEYFVDDDFGGHYKSVVGNCEASNTFSYIKIRDYILKLQSQLDIANKKLDKLDNEIKSVIKIVRQQPSESVEDDAWILGRLDSFLSIIWSD